MRPISVVAACAPRLRYAGYDRLRCSAAPTIWGTWITESLANPPGGEPDVAVTAKKSAEATSQGGIGRFLRDVYDELRKVVWPTWGELYRYTLVVIFTVIAIGGFIGGVDYLVGEIARRFIYSGVVH